MKIRCENCIDCDNNRECWLESIIPTNVKQISKQELIKQAKAYENTIKALDEEFKEEK